MPKMKSHSGSKKRFKATKSGLLKSRAAARGHRLVSKSKSAKRDARATMILRDVNQKVILKCHLPYLRRVKGLSLRKLKKTNVKEAA